MSNNNTVNEANIYYQRFREKNTEKIKEKVECCICGGSYDYFNKSQHKKSNKHLMALMRKYNININDTDALKAFHKIHMKK